MITENLLLSDFDLKFDKLKPYLTSDALSLVNGSEVMKAQIRMYMADEFTSGVEVDLVAVQSARYELPIKIGDQGEYRKGFAIFGSSRISSPVDFIRVLSHELGHYQVEGFSAALGIARENAISANDVSAYAAACNLTEGYARLASAKVIEEILATKPDGRTAALFCLMRLNILNIKIC